MIYFVIQGPQHPHSYAVIKQLNKLKIPYVVSTYPKTGLRTDQTCFIYNELDIEDISKQVLNYADNLSGRGPIIYQTFSTYKGLKHLVDVFKINDSDLIVKCRTDEFFDVEKFISKIGNMEDKDMFYNVEFMNHDSSISDHIFCCNFNLLYKVFENIWNIFIGKEEETEGIFKKNSSIEDIYFTYLNKHFHNFTKQIVQNVDIGPCHFRRNHQVSYFELDEFGNELKKSLDE